MKRPVEIASLQRSGRGSRRPASGWAGLPGARAPRVARDVSRPAASPGVSHRLRLPTSPQQAGAAPQASPSLAQVEGVRERPERERGRRVSQCSSVRPRSLSGQKEESRDRSLAGVQGRVAPGRRRQPRWPPMCHPGIYLDQSEQKPAARQGRRAAAAGAAPLTGTRRLTEGKVLHVRITSSCSSCQSAWHSSSKVAPVPLRPG